MPALAVTLSPSCKRRRKSSLVIVLIFIIIAETRIVRGEDEREEEAEDDEGNSKSRIDEPEQTRASLEVESLRASRGRGDKSPGDINSSTISLDSTLEPIYFGPFAGLAASDESFFGNIYERQPSDENAIKSFYSLTGSGQQSHQPQTASNDLHLESLGANRKLHGDFVTREPRFAGPNIRQAVLISQQNLPPAMMQNLLDGKVDLSRELQMSKHHSSQQMLAKPTGETQDVVYGSIPIQSSQSDQQKALNSHFHESGNFVETETPKFVKLQQYPMPPSEIELGAQNITSHIDNFNRGEAALMIDLAQRSQPPIAPGSFKTIERPEVLVSEPKLKQQMFDMMPSPRFMPSILQRYKTSARPMGANLTSLGDKDATRYAPQSLTPGFEQNMTTKSGPQSSDIGKQVSLSEIDDLLRRLRPHISGGHNHLPIENWQVRSNNITEQHPTANSPTQSSSTVDTQPLAADTYQEDDTDDSSGTDTDDNENDDYEESRREPATNWGRSSNFSSNPLIVSSAKLKNETEYKVKAANETVPSKELEASLKQSHEDQLLLRGLMDLTNRLGSSLSHKEINHEGDQGSSSLSSSNLDRLQAAKRVSKNISNDHQLDASSDIPIELLVDHLMSSSRLASFGRHHLLDSKANSTIGHNGNIGDNAIPARYADSDEEDMENAEADDDRDNNGTLPREALGGPLDLEESQIKANLSTSVPQEASDSLLTQASSFGLVANGNDSWIPLEGMQTKGSVQNRHVPLKVQKEVKMRQRRKRKRRQHSSIEPRVDNEGGVGLVVGDKVLSGNELIRLIGILNKTASKREPSRERDASRKLLRFLVKLVLEEYWRNKRAHEKEASQTNKQRREAMRNLLSSILASSADSLKSDDLKGSDQKRTKSGESDEQDEKLSSLDPDEEDIDEDELPPKTNEIIPINATSLGGKKKMPKGSTTRGQIGRGRSANVLGKKPEATTPAKDETPKDKKSLKDLSGDLELYFESDFFEDLSNKPKRNQTSGGTAAKDEDSLGEMQKRKKDARSSVERMNNQRDADRRVRKKRTRKKERRRSNRLSNDGDTKRAEPIDEDDAEFENDRLKPPRMSETSNNARRGTSSRRLGLGDERTGRRRKLHSGGSKTGESVEDIEREIEPKLRRSQFSHDLKKDAPVLHRRRRPQPPGSGSVDANRKWTDKKHSLSKALRKGPIKRDHRREAEAYEEHLVKPEISVKQARAHVASNGPLEERDMPDDRQQRKQDDDQDESSDDDDFNDSQDNDDGEEVSPNRAEKEPEEIKMKLGVSRKASKIPSRRTRKRRPSSRYRDDIPPPILASRIFPTPPAGKLSLVKFGSPNEEQPEANDDKEFTGAEMNSEDGQGVQKTEEKDGNAKTDMLMQKEEIPKQRQKKKLKPRPKMVADAAFRTKDSIEKAAAEVASSGEAKGVTRQTKAKLLIKASNETIPLVGSKSKKSLSTFGEKSSNNRRRSPRGDISMPPDEAEDKESFNETTRYIEGCDDEGSCQVSVQSSDPKLGKAIDKNDKPTIVRQLNRLMKDSDS